MASISIGVSANRGATASLGAHVFSRVTGPQATVVTVAIPQGLVGGSVAVNAVASAGSAGTAFAALMVPVGGTGSPNTGSNTPPAAPGAPGTSAPTGFPGLGTPFGSSAPAGSSVLAPAVAPLLPQISPVQAPRTAPVREAAAVQSMRNGIGRALSFSFGLLAGVQLAWLAMLVAGFGIIVVRLRIRRGRT